MKKSNTLQYTHMYTTAPQHVSLPASPQLSHAAKLIVSMVLNVKWGCVCFFLGKSTTQYLQNIIASFMGCWICDILYQSDNDALTYQTIKNEIREYTLATLLNATCGIFKLQDYITMIAKSILMVWLN